MTGQNRPNARLPTRVSRGAQDRTLLRVALAALACSVLLTGDRCLAQASEQESSARKAYTAGVAAFQSGDNATAYAHFALADQTFSSPNIKLMLGRTLARLSRRSEAYRVFHEALTTAGEAARYETTARAARDELHELEKQLAIVRIRIDESSDPAELRVDDRTIDRALWAEPLALEPGSVHIEIANAKGQSDAHQLELSAGSSVTLAMRIPENLPAAAVHAHPPLTAAKVTSPPASSHQLRSVSYAVAGVGLAGVAAFGVLGALSSHEFSNLEQACPNPRTCDSRYRDSATRGQTYQTVANVSLVVGGAALATGIVLWLVSLPKGTERRPVAITPHSLEWTGSF